jgi:hypothetical protein
MKIKNLKPKHHNFNSKLNGLHFVELIQNIPLIADGKVPQREGAIVVCLHLPRASILVFLT